MPYIAFECPHCLSSSTWQFRGKRISGMHIGENTKGTSGGDIMWQNCPSCGEIIIHFDPDIYEAPTTTNLGNQITKLESLREDSLLIYPKFKSPPKLSKHIPNEYRNDFLEAHNVLAVSPKASAALSRRCLQRLLRDKANVNPGTLSSEIDQILKSLPSELRNTVDAIRNFGNFAAHPETDMVTGDIIDVEPQEAEWTLEILKELLDFYIVKPAELVQKQKDLNTKLNNAGKKPMK